MITEIVRRIEYEINDSFDTLFTWFDVNAALLHYSPKTTGWSVAQNLEHVSLTNHYLLILIQKGTVKAVEKAAKIEYANLLKNYDVEWNKFEVIGKNKSFDWRRPQHMEPVGTMPLAEIETKLMLQQTKCTECLHKLQNGEGILYKTMMTVNGLGKIDVYQYIIFLVRHVQRHIEQMQKIKLEFDQL